MGIVPLTSTNRHCTSSFFSTTQMRATPRSESGFFWTSSDRFTINPWVDTSLGCFGGAFVSAAETRYVVRAITPTNTSLLLMVCPPAKTHNGTVGQGSRRRGKGCRVYGDTCGRGHKPGL